MILSFGWTWPAFVARVKPVTRRDWVDSYAVRWKRDICFDAYDRLPHFGGTKIGEGELTRDAYREPLAEMPNYDYFLEGFDWLYRHPRAVPPAARTQLWGDCTREGFEAWRLSGGSVWVVRYRVLSILSSATARLAKLLSRDCRGSEECVGEPEKRG